MSRYRNEVSECKVYIGDLPRNADEKEIERAFEHYGALKSVWVARNPPGFAFVEYEDPRDAQDAVRGLDGSSLCGSRIRVEHATGKSRPKNFGGRGGGGGGGGFGGRRDGPPFRGGRDSPRRNDRCYICGDIGHASYDCPRSSSGRARDYSGGRDYQRKRSPSPAWNRSRNKSRSRSYSRSPIRVARRSRSRN